MNNELVQLKGAQEHLVQVNASMLWAKGSAASAGRETAGIQGVIDKVDSLAKSLAQEISRNEPAVAALAGT